MREPSAPSQRSPAWWGADFIIRNGRVVIPASGGDIPFDLQLLADCARWFSYYVLVRAKSLLNVLSVRRGPRVYFTPAQPRPWYIVWSAMVWARLRFARSLRDADVALYFEDKTLGEAPDVGDTPFLNGGCLDVSKSHVAAIFEAIFGYPLALDPRRGAGVCVEKGEENGRHNGRLVTLPVTPAPGMTYQRYIHTAIGGAARDLRTPCVGGRPVIVMVKTKPANQSFSIQNTSVKAAAVGDVFTPEEIHQIVRFNAAMGLDWGSLDVLRETATGRIYIVDVNKTDTGPPVVLSWRDRIAVTGAVATALRSLVEARAGARGGASARAA